MYEREVYWCDQFKDEVGGACSTHGIDTSTYNILVGTPNGKRLLDRSRRGWEDNIRMGLTEIMWERVDWMHLALNKER
jgi:hypothetical protein